MASLLQHHQPNQAANLKSYGSIPSVDDEEAANVTWTRRPVQESAPPTSHISASWLSKLLFSYANPVLALGNVRQLNQDDLWHLEGENRTSEAYRKFKTQYIRHGESTERALLATYGWDFFACGIGSLVTAACGVFAPVVLHHVIDAFSAPVVDMNDLALWLGAFFASRLLNAFVDAHVKFRIEIVMLRLTVSLKSLIFEKAMRRSVQSKHEADTVDISNLFTADMDNFIWLSYSVNSLWILPIQIVIVVFMLYAVLDVAAFAGAAVMLLSLGLNSLVYKRYAASYEALTDLKDNRMKAVKEVFGAIQIVKLNAWEGKFLARIQTWRDQELSVLARSMYTFAWGTFLFWSTEIYVSVASFATYALVMGETLTAAKVFTSMMLFNVVGRALSFFPEAVQEFLQARISLGRVGEYLSASDVDRSRVSSDATGYSHDVMAALEDVTLSWDTRGSSSSSVDGIESDANADDGDSNGAGPVLSNVNLVVKRGDFVVVHGAVGAGKSSLCAALLGEIPITHGNVFVRSGNGRDDGSSGSTGNGGVAYYSQQPWIQNMSVRENILFGQPFDAERYERVLDACGLVTDVQQFPAGDATEIGQRGINLSGGQKARLSLARACYSSADVFVLDAPLAAVDAVVQSEIFCKCICGLLETKTVVLVTHNPEIIRSEAVDVRVEVLDGTVRCERVDRQQPRHVYGKLAVAEAIGSDDAGDDAETAAMETAGDASDNDDGVLIQDEERQAGRVSSAVFRGYFDAIGGWKSALVFFTVLVAWQSCQVASDVWLSHWTGRKDDRPLPTASVAFNLEVYALLGVMTSVFVLIRAALGTFFGVRAARHLFDDLTLSLLHAPMRFFDANPIGRILNRYAEDVSTTDQHLQYKFFGIFITAAINGFRLVAALFVIKYASVLVLPLTWLYVRLGQFYLENSREVTRLLKVANSPVLSHVTSSEDGVVVLRAFGPSFMHRAIARNFELIDTNNRAWYAEALVNQWFALRVQLLGCALVVLVVSSLVWFKDVLSPGLVGLAFMYVITVEGELTELVRTWSELELAMVSPERIMEYIGIAPEGCDKVVTFDAAKHTEWPTHGNVAFERVVFSYKPGASPVLKDVSFEARGGEKIGIVGRTGAGKSSLTMALFRINELSSGRIAIDGVDIASVALPLLRSRLSIIPQSPVLFKGSLRAYMDPFEAFSDAQIWSALEKVGLTDLVGGLERKLSHELSENGENLSVGERQLLCLARALLRESRVVVLDEATASIDHATERRLQAMIAREFAAATVLTIAHRLATVLSSDRILVLDDGRVVEFGAPQELVQQVDGAFYELAREGGCLGHFA